MPNVTAEFSREELKILEDGLTTFAEYSGDREDLPDILILRIRVRKMLAYSQEPT